MTEIPQHSLDQNGLLSDSFPSRRLPRFSDSLPDAPVDMTQIALEKALDRAESATARADIATFLNAAASGILFVPSILSIVAQQPNWLAIILDAAVVCGAVGSVLESSHSEKRVVESEDRLDAYILEQQKQAFFALSPEDQTEILAEDDDMVARYTIYNLFRVGQLRFEEVLPAICALDLNLLDGTKADDFEKDGGNDTITLADVVISRAVLWEKYKKLPNSIASTSIDLGVLVLDEIFEELISSLSSPGRRSQLEA